MNDRPSGFVCAAIVLLVAGCGAMAKVGAPDPRVVTLFGGATNLAPVQQPSKVEALRVSSAAPQPAATDVKKIGEWSIVAGPVAVDAKTAAELTAIFLNPETYDWESAKACEFDPGVAFRFVGESGAIDILLCFTCDEMAIMRDGKRVGGEDTDRARKRLVAIAKQLFPDDAKIQALAAH